MNNLKRTTMPRLNTPNSLYKFMTAKLCHPMRICVEDLTHWCVNDWYGQPCSKHIYYITKYENRIEVRYESNYWYGEIIHKCINQEQQNSYMN